ncbi:MAG: RNA-binding domain-containing protein [Thermoguttaceae bacterium]
MDHELKQLLEAVEGENVEFKEAKDSFSSNKLAQYACAVANCGGGKIVFGVTDKRPRKIVGTNAFEQPERTLADLMRKLPLRIQLQFFEEGEKKVIVFNIPSRPIGVPIQIDGQYWTRQGDSQQQMEESELRQIFAESGHDFSADACPNAELSDLDSNAIEDFRGRWINKSRNEKLQTLSPQQLLKDCEVITRDGITYSGLILFGTKEALGRLLGQCEVIFEYRSSEISGPAQHREEFRQGFFLYYDKLWELINRRNDMQHFQNGLFIDDVPTFEERTIREGLLNAISHRNYQYSGSIFIRQYARKLVIESPGGLPHDVTVDNILDRQSPRNRRLADVFSKCGLVERSGQGMNLMFEQNIRQAKPLPDFTGTDKDLVRLTLEGSVQDEMFLVMLSRIGREQLALFSTEDFLVLNAIHQEKPIDNQLKNRLPRLLEVGAVEKVGRGKYILSKKYYHLKGKKGTYTRLKGLDRNTQKELLLKHIRERRPEGTPLSELGQVLPSCRLSQIQVFLRELRKAGKIEPRGRAKAGRWFTRDDDL